jgi:hypothetical protein
MTKIINFPKGGKNYNFSMGVIRFYNEGGDRFILNQKLINFTDRKNNKMAMDVSPEKMSKVFEQTIQALANANTFLSVTALMLKLPDDANPYEELGDTIDYADHFLRMYKLEHGVE